MSLPAVLALLALLVAGISGPAAAEFRPTVVYSFGGKGDNAFNAAGALGVAQYRQQTGQAVKEVEALDLGEKTIDGLVDLLDRLARDGADPIIALGFNFQAPLAVVAARYPQTRFAILDTVVDQPNVTSVNFREHEGSFLVGMLAAMASRSKVLGFIGGAEHPIIRRFECGFLLGARHIDPGIRVLSAMVGTGGEGFISPDKAYLLALAQTDRKADVIFQAAGSSGEGVFRAVGERGILGVGVDNNQNGVLPGRVLTSMLKRVEVAVYRLLDRARAGQWISGIESLGLAEEGVGWALDRYNAALITNEMQDRVSQAQFEIIAEILAVPDGAAAACPVRPES